MIGKLKREVGNLVVQSCCFCPVWWETAKFDLSSENNERFLPLIWCIIISCTAEIYHPFCLILSEASSNLTSLIATLLPCEIAALPVVLHEIELSRASLGRAGHQSNRGRLLTLPSEQHQVRLLTHSFLLTFCLKNH